MSALCTRSSSCPLVTVSPSRASISTTRPVAREITGTVLEMSGFTVPVTLQLRRCVVGHRRRQGKLVGMIRTENVRIPGGLDSELRRSARGRIVFRLAAPGQQNAEH